MQPSTVLSDYESKPVRPALQRFPPLSCGWEAIAFSHCRKKFQPGLFHRVFRSAQLGVAPVDKIGRSAPLANTEVVSDSTTWLALECSVPTVENSFPRQPQVHPSRFISGGQSPGSFGRQHYENPALVAYFSRCTCSAVGDSRATCSSSYLR